MFCKNINFKAFKRSMQLVRMILRQIFEEPEILPTYQFQVGSKRDEK